MRTRVSLAGVVFLAALALPATAATISFNFTGSSSQGSIGNSRVFTDQNGSGITVTATALSTTGSNSTLAAAALGRYGGGLGVCNSVEFGGGGCTYTTTPPEHAVTNNNFNDFVLLVFSTSVNLGNVSLNAYGGTDISYFSGNLTGAAAGTQANSGALSVIGLGTAGGGTGATSYALSGSGVTALLIGAKLGDTNDGFKISGLTGNNTVVPEPATYTLLGSALLAIGLLRRRMVR
ncbi:MAG: PEP-CTERM sorting domain-containing protein [Acidobacteria bacterium]|nr:PEP-CTERM sorting domain-containing protein [Acidobacteriota bacterium]